MKSARAENVPRYLTSRIKQNKSIIYDCDVIILNAFFAFMKNGGKTFVRCETRQKNGVRRDASQRNDAFDYLRRGCALALCYDKHIYLEPRLDCAATVPTPLKRAATHGFRK